MRFSVVDVETSGLSTRRHHLLEVAVVTVDLDADPASGDDPASGAAPTSGDDAVPGDGITGEWESRVRLRWPLQRVGPRKVHGISRSDLRGAPRLRQVMTRFAELTNGTILVAHNLDFDLEFLTRASDKVGVPLSPSATLCTLHLSRRLDPERVRRHRLSDLASRYQVVNDRPHNALHDARTTALVLPHLLRDAGATTESDVLHLVEQQHRQG